MFPWAVSSQCRSWEAKLRLLCFACQCCLYELQTQTTQLGLGTKCRYRSCGLLASSKCSANATPYQSHHE